MAQKLKIIFLGIIFFALPIFVNADYVGQTANFFVDPSYDLEKREEISTTLQKISQNLYFYIDDRWWNSLDYSQRDEIRLALDNLVAEFDYKIYPFLTSTFGLEWKPGIDKDERITILIHPMIEEAGGYFNNGNEYPKIQNPKSNEREMIYLNVRYLLSPIIKSYLAHEFTHLIIFNQKEKLRNVSEEVWLNEARADFSPTLLGYNDKYQASNLEQRAKTFLSNSNDSLTEWRNQKADYGVVNLFTHYLVDHYGIKILADSLQSSKTGIPSINEALAKNGFSEDFSKIFTDWTIAVFLGDCQVGQKYCYKNENLKNFGVIPSLIFLPSTQRTSIFLDYSIKQWSGNWYRIIGGKGDLTLDFDGEDSVDFKVGYVLCSSSCQVKFLELDGQKKGKLSLENFGENWSSLNLIPSIQSKVSGFSEQEPLYPFSISASIKIKTERESLIEELTAKISELQAQIVQLRAALSEISDKRPGAIPDNFSFEKNLFLGMADPDVAELKIILDKEVLHQSWSGNEYFGKSALAAVKLFQEKYKNEISQFSGYPIQVSGFVGRGTRAKLNELLKK